MTSYELFAQCEMASLVEFGSHFSKCQNAFRLELLERYTEDSETEFFQKYENGIKECPKEFNLEWLSILQQAKFRNAEFRRARYIPPGEMPSYMRFEIDWGYSKNSYAGEIIKTFSQSLFSLIAEKIGIVIDFWLFDDTHCFLMLYDVEGRFLGVAKTTSQITPLFLDVKNIIWESSIPFKRN